jgi:pimeloyl-ACP methyl ester carboxylesterase
MTAATKRFSAILLPGSVLPAEFAFPDLVMALGEQVDARPKELEVYASDSPPQDFGLETEVEGIRREADDAGFERFHLFGYSGGGASALAFAATYPERLLSLALSEPAWAGNRGLKPEEAGVWKAVDRLVALPPDQMMPAFVRLQLRDGVEAPPRPSGPPPSWMQKRPAGIRAFISAFKKYDLDYELLGSFDRPVYFAIGRKSNPNYFEKIAERLGAAFPDFTLEVFEDRHHFDPPHRAEPQRFARSLRELWERAEASR